MVNAMSFLDAFGAGQQYRQQQEAMELQRQERQRMEGMRNTQGKAQAALMGGDTQAARQLAIGSGDAETMQAIQAQISQMGAADREAARERVRGLGSAAYTLARIPAAQRSQWVMQNGRSLAGLGIDPRQVAQMDLSDQNLAAFIRQAESMEQEFFAPYTLGENETRVTASGQQTIGQAGVDARGLERAGLNETRRSNMAGEDINRSRVQLGRDELSEARRQFDLERNDERGTGREQQTARRIAEEFARQDQIFNTIDRAIGQVGGFTAGIAEPLRRIPGTPASNLDATLDTIRANVGFEELNRMRQMSPTGGALGQVTERELRFLQSVMASLEQSQGPDQLRQNLASVRDQIRASRQRVADAYREDFGSYPPGYGEAPRAAPRQSQMTQGQDDPLGIRY